MGAAVVAAKLTERAVDLRGVREGKRRVIVGEPVEPIDLEVDGRPLPGRGLNLARAGLLLRRLDRELPIEELLDRLGSIRRAIEDGLRRHAATVAARSDGGARLARCCSLHARGGVSSARASLLVCVQSERLGSTTAMPASPQMRPT